MTFKTEKHVKPYSFIHPLPPSDFKGSLLIKSTDIERGGLVTLFFDVESVLPHLIAHTAVLTKKYQPQTANY